SLLGAQRLKRQSRQRRCCQRRAKSEQEFAPCGASNGGGHCRRCLNAARKMLNGWPVKFKICAVCKALHRLRSEVLWEPAIKGARRVFSSRGTAILRHGAGGRPAFKLRC